MIVLFFGIILIAVLAISFIRETFSDPTASLISHLVKPSITVKDADEPK